MAIRRVGQYKVDCSVIEGEIGEPAGQTLLPIIRLPKLLEFFPDKRNNRWTFYKNFPVIV